MVMTDKYELQKTIGIAKEFIERSEGLMAEIEHEDAINSGKWKYSVVSPATTGAVRRQSMELTRQLAILRKA